MPQFPSDLGSKHYMTFQFMQYERSSVTSGSQLMPGAGASVVLPMPDKINDIPSVSWTEDSSVSDMMKGALGSLGNVATGLAGYQFGVVPNPFLVMLFKRPNFKEFTFSWTLAPTSQEESQTLTDILNIFRKNMLPSKTGGSIGGISAGLKYPNIVQPRFDSESRKHMFEFKPCAVKSVHFDYTGSGMPAFFKNSKAPAQVRLTISLIELEYWTQEDVM